MVKGSTSYNSDFSCKNHAYHVAHEFNREKFDEWCVHVTCVITVVTMTITANHHG